MIVRIAIISDDLSYRDNLCVEFMNYLTSGKSPRDIYSGVSSDNIHVRTKSPLIDSIFAAGDFSPVEIDKYLQDQGRRSSDSVISERVEKMMYESKDIYYILYPYTPLDIFISAEEFRVCEGIEEDSDIDETSSVYLDMFISSFYDKIHQSLDSLGLSSYNILEKYMRTLKFHSVFGMFNSADAARKYSVLGLSMAVKNNFYYGGNLEINKLFIPRGGPEGTVVWEKKEFIKEDDNKEEKIRTHVENYVDNSLHTHLEYWINELLPK